MTPKLLLLSIVIMLVTIPIVCAADASPRRGLRKAVALMFAYSLIYLFAVRFIYPRLL